MNYVNKSDDLLIVSMHEKGFPQADFYPDGQHFTDSDWDGSIPSSHATGKIGESQNEFAARIGHEWPSAKIEIQ